MVDPISFHVSCHYYDNPNPNISRCKFHRDTLQYGDNYCPPNNCVIFGITEIMFPSGILLTSSSKLCWITCNPTGFTYTKAVFIFMFHLFSQHLENFQISTLQEIRSIVSTLEKIKSDSSGELKEHLTNLISNFNDPYNINTHNVQELCRQILLKLMELEEVTEGLKTILILKC